MVYWILSRRDNERDREEKQTSGRTPMTTQVGPRVSVIRRPKQNEQVKNEVNTKLTQLQLLSEWLASTETTCNRCMKLMLDTSRINIVTKYRKKAFSIWPFRKQDESCFVCVLRGCLMLGVTMTGARNFEYTRLIARLAYTARRCMQFHRVVKRCLTCASTKSETR